MLDAAAAAFRDSAFGKIVDQLSSQNLRDVDAARGQVDPWRSRHPVVRDVFVVSGGVISYPRIDPPLLRPLDDFVKGEHLLRACGDGRVLAGAGSRGFDPTAALKAYTLAATLARTPDLQALAFAGVARSQTGAGIELQRPRCGKTDPALSRPYSPSGRPYGLVAAVELTS